MKRKGREEVANVQWIKIVTDIFDDEKILLIETMPDHDAIIVIWFKLLCLAGKQNNSGVLMLNERVACTDEMLSAIFRRPINTVRLALKTFEEFGMIEIVNNAITIPNWEKHQQLGKLELARESTRKRVAAHRERQRLLASPECNALQPVTVTESNGGRIDKIRIDKKREEDIRDRDKGVIGGEENDATEDDITPSADASGSPPPSSPVRHKYGQYSNVLLTDADMDKLKAEFPEDYENRIERLSEYIASTGKKYKNHLATIRNWARRDGKEGGKQDAKRGGHDGGTYGANAPGRYYGEFV